MASWNSSPAGVGDGTAVGVAGSAVGVLVAVGKEAVGVAGSANGVLVAVGRAAVKVGVVAAATEGGSFGAQLTIHVPATMHNSPSRMAPTASLRPISCLNM